MVKKTIKKKSHPVKNKKIIKTSIKHKPILKKRKKEEITSHHIHHKIPQNIHLSSNESNTEKILIANFVSLQKVMTHLSLKFDNLTKQISKLLELFEISAKALAEKDFDLEKGGKDKKIIEKMDNLLDQNKIIAQGLTLMHEKIPEQKLQYPPVQVPQIPQQQIQQPLIQKPQVKTEGYQKSISSRSPPESPTTNLQER
jgi:hypothetical protein